MQLDVLPDALAVPISLADIDSPERAGFAEWLLHTFDVDPEQATQVLPDQLLGMVVATAEGWTGLVWSGATLDQQKLLLDQLCVHGALGDLRGATGDWWLFPLQNAPTPQEGYYVSPEDRVHQRLLDQTLAQEDPVTLLATEEFWGLKTLAQKLQIPLKTLLFWAARHGTEPMWIGGQSGLWANEPAKRLDWTPSLPLGLTTAATPQGWSTFQHLIIDETSVILRRPTPRLREVSSTDLQQLLATSNTLDWITAGFEETIQTLVPFLERLQVRVVLCLSGPNELESFFNQLCHTLEHQDLPRTLLSQARRRGDLQIRLGVGLSPRYQIALLQDSYGDGLYYYAAPDVPRRTLASWEGDIQDYRQRFEVLWNTAVDRRLQIIDLSDLLAKYNC